MDKTFKRNYERIFFNDNFLLLAVITILEHMPNAIIIKIKERQRIHKKNGFTHPVNGLKIGIVVTRGGHKNRFSSSQCIAWEKQVHFYGT
jgi:hypothetical protein